MIKEDIRTKILQILVCHNLSIDGLAVVIGGDKNENLRILNSLFREGNIDYINLPFITRLAKTFNLDYEDVLGEVDENYNLLIKPKKNKNTKTNKEGLKEDILDVRSILLRLNPNLSSQDSLSEEVKEVYKKLQESFDYEVKNIFERKSAFFL